MAEILVVGYGSFLGQAFLRNNPDLNLWLVSGHEALSLRDLSGVIQTINFAWHPAMNDGHYDEAWDIDLHLAKLTQGAHLMISSRKVYAPQAQWGSRENDPLEGTDAYGANKIRVEKTLQKALPPDRLTVLRPGNVIGFEYPRNRTSFMGFILKSLKETGAIRFTTDPAGERDFISDDHFATILRQVLEKELRGVFNVGAGKPTPIGSIADWVLEGYGSGSRTSESNVKSGEFFLNTESLAQHVPLRWSNADLKDYCIALGQRLRGN